MCPVVNGQDEKGLHLENLPAGFFRVQVALVSQIKSVKSDFGFLSFFFFQFLHEQGKFSKL